MQHIGVEEGYISIFCIREVRKSLTLRFGRKLRDFEPILSLQMRKLEAQKGKKANKL